jgi:hypothetical protein
MTLDRSNDNINKGFKLENATEHTFHVDLQQFLERKKLMFQFLN